MKGRPKHDQSLGANDAKVPKADPALTGPAYPHKPLWKFRGIDLAGPWGCHELTKEHLLSLVEKLSDFETMTWSQIEQKRGKHAPQNHEMPVAAICSKAQGRLKELKYDDVDVLYSLHIAQLRRLWGIRRGHVFHVLWWDPEHTVYATKGR